jgi:hypothetical protein
VHLRQVAKFAEYKYFFEKFIFQAIRKAAMQRVKGMEWPNYEIKIKFKIIR